MKILLTGSGGLLGQKLINTAPKQYSIYPTFNINYIMKNDIKLDITNNNNVNDIIKKIKPNIIIHAASMGDIEKCELNKTSAYQVNVLGTNNLLNAAKHINAKFIFFSTNAVFDGSKPPYHESDKTNPINYYGKTKVISEQTIINTYFNNSIVFRFSTIYGWNKLKERNNPATWLIKRLKQGQQTYVVKDIYNNHLWVGQATKAIWKAIQLEKYMNIFHIAGKNCMSRYEFALNIADIFKLNKKLITPVTSNFFSKITTRAKNTCLDSNKAKRELNIYPVTLKKGLIKMKLSKINSRIQ